MKTYFSDGEIHYDGSQLKSLFGYLHFGVLGDSAVSWVGSCNIPFDKMVDGEDLLSRSEIRGDRMVHFIVEKFDIDLFAAVSLQRLLASLAIDLLREISPNNEIAQKLQRDGDDIFYDKQKLSISIATKSPVSALIHFAVNVVNTGTPVSTLSLQDLAVDPTDFAKRLLGRFSREAESILMATRKVIPVGATAGRI